MGTNAREVGDFSIAVSAELRGAIAKAGYSVRAFAKASRLPLTTLHKTLRAERVVDVEDLAQICDALRIEPSDILERAERELGRRTAMRVVADSRYTNGGEDAIVVPLRLPSGEVIDEMKYAADTMGRLLG